MFQEEKDNLVNIVRNIVGKLDVVESKNKNREVFKVVNFSVVSKDDEGKLRYIIIDLHTEKRVIFRKNLSKEISLSSLDRSELLLMITARNTLTTGYLLQDR